MQKLQKRTSATSKSRVRAADVADVADAVAGAGSDLENGEDTEHPQYPIPARVVENKTAPEIEKQGQLRESYVTSESGTSIVKSSRFSVLPVQIT